MLKRLKQTSKYRGVTLMKRTGRGEAHCRVGGMTTGLGTFGSEEEAARACDRMKLWRCKADGKRMEQVKVNFPLSDYNDTEVTALQRCTQEEMVEKLRRAGKAVVQRPATPGPVAVKRGAAGVEAPAVQPPLKKIKVTEVKTAPPPPPEETEGSAAARERKAADVETRSAAAHEAERARADAAESTLATEREHHRVETEAAAAARARERSELEAERREVAGLRVEAETLAKGPTCVTMSGNHLACGICFEEFDDADATGAAARHMFWPCQHARQYGGCASRVWKTPAKRRRCPWCSAKIDSRPRPLKPYV
jgi:hypothetical protein